MIVLYAEKEDMGIRYAAALGGINYEGIHIDSNNLNDYIKDIKKKNKGYIETTYNNNSYVITWGWGHFGTLKDIKDYNPEYDKWRKIPLPFLPPKYEVKRIENQNDYFRKRDAKQFALIKKLFNSDRCEYIINATDWEREGELIFAYVYDLTGTKKPYKRLRNTAKTDKEIRKAMDNLVSERDNYPFVLAARGRAIADWAIGVNLTIAATLYLGGGRSLLNVGRVQTPTLNLIVDRENEILNFQEKKSYGITGKFKTNTGEYDGKTEVLESKEAADKVMKGLSGNGTIKSIETKREVKKPPLLHNTNTLQIEANEVYGYTLEQTLNIAQKLYESGFITYPRVDSQYLTEDKKSEMPGLITLLMQSNRYKQYTGPTVMPDRYFNDKKVDGHDAIIATDVLPRSLPEEQLNIYDLVVRRMLMAVSKDMIAQKTTVITEVDGIEFKSHGTIYEEKGWVNVAVKSNLSDAELPILNEGDVVSGTYEIYEQVSKPPARYTDATLIKAMENCGKKMEDEEAKEYLKKSKGIGRPATRAALVERLIKSEYIERKKKSLVPTQKGMEAIKAISINEIKSPILTAEWEKMLDEIECSAPTDCVQQLARFIKSINDTTTKWCSELENCKVINVGGKESLGVNCPVCGMPMAEGKDNYYCSGYKDGCKFTVKKKICDKNITKTMLTSLINNGSTAKLKSFKGKTGKLFDAKLILVPAKACPICGYPQKGDTCYKDKVDLVPSNYKIVDFQFDQKKGRR